MAKTNKSQLNKYIIDYVKNTDNMGNIIMLSGTWGIGKTYYWINEIIPKLKKESKSNIYI